MALPPPNYDEAQVPDYTLPELLLTARGETVTSAALWQEQRRPELLESFRRYVYGRLELSPNVAVRPIVTRAPASTKLQ